MKFFTKEFLLVLSAALLLSSVSLYAYPGGVSGYTRKGLTPGCTCHTSTANPGVSVLIKGPASLKTGQTADYTVVLTYSALSAAGVDIAASSGSLSTSDTRLQMINGELTQKTKNTGSGSITWTFKYSAPVTAGTVTLYATACGVKNAWNNSPDFSVTVTQASTLSLISPNGGENWQTGLVKDITWSGAGVDNVKIEYTTDNGTSWNTIIASTTASANKYSWTVPNAVSSNCKIRISNAADTSLFSVSASPFSIVKSMPVYSISHLRQNDASGATIDANQILTVKGTVTVGNELGSPSYIQDSTGGVAVYGRGTSAFSGMVKIGDVVQLTGTVVNYNGLTEFNPVSEFTRLDSNKTTEPKVLTISQINKETWQSGVEPYEGLLVRINHVKLLTASATWAVSGSGSNFNVTDGTDTLQVRIYSTVTSLANQGAPSGWFDITGALGQYKASAPYQGGYQLQPRFAKDVIALTDVKSEQPMNYNFSLGQNFPNPFNPATTITFSLKEQTDAVLTIYNSIGSKVEILKKERMNAGTHSITWNAGSLPSGTYFCELRTGRFSAVRKILLLK